MRNLIVVPAYNEEASIRAVLRSLSTLPDCYEVLVVDDGSVDKTFELASAEIVSIGRPGRVLSLACNTGIGSAVQTGYRFAADDGGYSYVIQFDGDGQHDVDCIVPLVEACESGDSDLCVGNRFHSSQVGDRSTVYRRIGIRVLSRTIQFLTGSQLADPTSGFRCAGPRAWKSFAKIYPDDYPEPESIVWCLRNGLRVTETPVSMRVRTGGESSIGPGKAVFYMLKVICCLVLARCRPLEV